MNSERKINDKSLVVNALSIDVEDWYQVAEFESTIEFSDWDKRESRVIQNTVKILDILSEYNVKATFFILTWNAERFPHLIRRIDKAGHEIATHGYAHRLIYQQSKEEFRDDLTKSINILEQITNKKVLGYRAPTFSITRDSLWALDILLECGLRYDSSIFPIADSVYGIEESFRYPHVIKENNTAKLIEFPMSTARLLGKNLPIAGGAYLRLFPYRYIKWGIKQINKYDKPAMIYMHPWEIDTEQPRLKIESKRLFSVHYLKLNSTEKKLRKLLQDFHFAPVKDVLQIE